MAIRAGIITSRRCDYQPTGSSHNSLMSERIQTLLKVVPALLICCCSIVCLGAERFNFNSQVGIVDNDREGRLCLAIRNSRLTVGTAVVFIMPHKPQRVAKAVISSKSASSCSSTAIPENNASFYWLELLRKKSIDLSMPMSPAIAVVRTARPILVKRGTASGDIDGDGRAEFFRTCVYSDEIFLTVWSSRPLLGKRR
jgi:hypothetical protein